MTLKVIMANDLITGDVIFLYSNSQTWTKYLDEAWISSDDKLIEQMLHDANESHLVIDAQAIDVIKHHGTVELKVYREQLRSLGPSVRPDLGKQAVSRAA